jgi:hypothetical protein
MIGDRAGIDQLGERIPAIGAGSQQVPYHEAHVAGLVDDVSFVGPRPERGRSRAGRPARRPTYTAWGHARTPV